MKPLNGQCYNIRERLKELGCRWDGATEKWFAPEDCWAEAQGLVDIENKRAWMEYLGTLPWCEGSFSTTVWEAGLRGASLYIPYQEAWAEIAGRVRAVKPVQDGWFNRNIGRAYAAAEVPGETTLRSAPGEKRVKPVFQPQVLEKLVTGLEEETNLAWLASRSPVDPVRVTAEDFLGALYEPWEKVMVFEVFRGQGEWVYSGEDGMAPSTVAPAALYERKATPWDRGGRAFDGRGPVGIWFLNNPVDGDWRWMKEVSGDDDPHWSRRFHECVTQWRYLVLESDTAKARQWVAMAVQLPLRIVAIYTSGGKSVHVLVRLDAGSKEELDAWRDEMKPVVVPLGADPVCLTAVRLTRLPSCWRLGDFVKDGSQKIYRAYDQPRPQKLLYLNPSADMTPIVSRPVVRDAVGPWERLALSMLETHAEERDPEALAACLRGLKFYESVPGFGALRRQLEKTIL